MVERENDESGPCFQGSEVKVGRIEVGDRHTCMHSLTLQADPGPETETFHLLISALGF